MMRFSENAGIKCISKATWKVSFQECYKGSNSNSFVHMKYSENLLLSSPPWMACMVKIRGSAVRPWIYVIVSLQIISCICLLFQNSVPKLEESRLRSDLLLSNNLIFI